MPVSPLFLYHHQIKVNDHKLKKLPAIGDNQITIPQHLQCRSCTECNKHVLGFVYNEMFG